MGLPLQNCVIDLVLRIKSLNCLREGDIVEFHMGGKRGNIDFCCDFARQFFFFHLEISLFVKILLL